LKKTHGLTANPSEPAKLTGAAAKPVSCISKTPRNKYLAASRARARFSNSLNDPSGSRTRHIPG
jgi:hypothetical protein